MGGGFAEKDSAARLTIKEQNGDSVVSGFGIHVSRPFETQKIKWVSDLHLGYRRQWLNPNNIAAQFAAGGDAFKVKPEDAGKDMATAGTGLTAILSETISIHLNYDLYCKDQSSAHMINIGVSAGF